MIDLRLVIGAALSVLGASVVLAAASYHRWLAHETRTTLRHLLTSASRTIPYSTGLFLFSAGFAMWPGVGWPQRAVWCAFALLFGGHAAVSRYSTIRPDRGPRPDGHPL